MKSKFYYIGLNLFIPGFGQIAAKRYMRGALQILGSIGSVFWFAAEVAMPFMEFYNSDLEGELPKINVSSLIIPVLLFVAILLWSIIDLMSGINKTNCKKIEDN